MFKPECLVNLNLTTQSSVSFPARRNIMRKESNIHYEVWSSCRQYVHRALLPSCAWARTACERYLALAYRVEPWQPEATSRHPCP